MALWVVLCLNEQPSCKHCDQVLTVAVNCGLVHIFSLPPKLARSVGGLSHAYVILGCAQDPWNPVEGTVRVSSLCNPNTTMLGGVQRYLLLKQWPEFYEHPEALASIELMALAGRSPEQVWLDWQYTLGRTVRDWYVTGEWL